jgi:hypothetical protein
LPKITGRFGAKVARAFRRTEGGPVKSETDHHAE